MVAIVLKLDLDSMSAIVGMHNLLADVTDPSFAMDFSDTIPHLSLIHAPGAKATEELVQSVQRFFDRGASERAAMTIETERRGLTYVPEGWYFLDVRKTEALVELHEGAFQALSGFAVPGASDFDRISHYSQSQKANYVRYGYRYIHEDFYPHITVCRTKSKCEAKLTDDAIAGIGVMVPERIRCSGLLLCEIGRDGTTGAKIIESH